MSNLEQVLVLVYLKSGVNILHYSQILHLGKVSYFQEPREEFLYFGVRAQFCRESLNLLQANEPLKLFP